MSASKPFLTYEKQIKKLRDEKGLEVLNEAHAIDILTQVGYFSLINGYKIPFKDTSTVYIAMIIRTPRKCLKYLN